MLGTEAPSGRMTYPRCTPTDRTREWRAHAIPRDFIGNPDGADLHYLQESAKLNEWHTFTRKREVPVELPPKIQTGRLRGLQFWWGKAKSEWPIFHP